MKVEFMAGLLSLAAFFHKPELMEVLYQGLAEMMSHSPHPYIHNN